MKCTVNIQIPLFELLAQYNLQLPLQEREHEFQVRWTSNLKKTAVHTSPYKVVYLFVMVDAIHSLFETEHL